MRNRQGGFTMIEVVLAFAIATLLVAMTGVTVTALRAAAQRQAEAATTEARLGRFNELLRRDLRGWIAIPGSSGDWPRPIEAGEEVLLSFRTTADALNQAAYGEQGFQALRYTQVLYRLRKTEKRFQIIRQEQDAQGVVTEVPLLTMDKRPKIELLRDEVWIDASDQRSPSRPQAARMTVAGRAVWVRLGA